MCEQNFAFLCCTLFLLIISSSKSQQNFTNNEEKGDNLTVRNEEDTDFTTIYSDEIKTLEYMYEKFANNNTQYDHNHEDEDQILMNSHSSTNVSYKENFTSQKNYENLIVQNDSVLYEVFENFTESSKSNVVPYEMCHNITCILLCCPLGHRVDGSICIPEKTKHFFPYVYAYVKDAKGSESKTVDEFFPLTVHNSCEGKARYTLPAGYEDEFMIFPNGSVYLSPYKIFAKSPLYCLGVFWNKGDVYQVAFCADVFDEIKEMRNEDISWNEHIVSYLVSVRIMAMLFLLITFLVYALLPEFRNVHGIILRNYCGAYFIAYLITSLNYLTDNKEYHICVAIAFFMYFFSLSANIWLITISFDMWRTFRGFCSLQKSIRQRENRKLIYYSLYAWGFPFILATFCVIMESVSSRLPEIWRPEFQLGDCWFSKKETLMIYFYDWRSICIISSVCFSISASMNIARYEKETRTRLSDSDSKQYNDNKKWLQLYLRLFIVQFVLLIIQWVMRVLYLFNYIPDAIGYYIDVIDIPQHICTFIIFVCKKKVIIILLKRFGCKTNDVSSSTT